jgi:hypothetical protein
VIEEHIHEEICKEDLDDEDLNETPVSIFSLDESEFIHPFLPLADEDKIIIIGFNDIDDLMEDPYDMVDQHIDDFIHVERRILNVVCFTFDKDPIYNVEGSSQT